jgi:hypothetical protein
MTGDKITRLMEVKMENHVNRKPVADQLDTGTKSSGQRDWKSSRIGQLQVSGSLRRFA